MIKRKKNITNAKKTMLLVCATEAEALYFQQMRKDCRYANLTVMKAAKSRTLKEIIDSTQRAKSNGKFDSAWALFGFDDVSTDVDEVLSYEEYAAKKKVGLCYFNPKFTLWFALHLISPKTFIRDVDSVANELDKLIPGYRFTEEYLKGDGSNLHIRLFPRHSSADINARNYNVIAENQTGLPATTMPSLNMEIIEICGSADMSHNQKAR